MMDRKELKRQYKETPRPMGAYRVLNTRTGRALIATSTDVNAILNRHRAQLGFGGHPDGELQRDWDAMGADTFTFEILDTLKPNDEPGYDPTADLKVLGELWIEKLSAGRPPGYQLRARRAAPADEPEEER